MAGAAITDFVSFAGEIHWGPGLPEFGHWETGQARMARPPWEDLAGHLESSPVNFIDDLTTPVLLMHGDADGTVDFRQGQEYYNYARRAGKQVIMLVYPGADHGLRKKEHQVDYHRRILQWFGHWLKGEPAPDWISFTLGAVNPLRRRFPLYMATPRSCGWIFKGAECAYAGGSASCARTLDACRTLSNSGRFGGRPGITGAPRFVTR